MRGRKSQGISQEERSAGAKDARLEDRAGASIWPGDSRKVLRQEGACVPGEEGLRGKWPEARSGCRVARDSGGGTQQRHGQHFAGPVLPQRSV